MALRLTTLIAFVSLAAATAAQAAVADATLFRIFLRDGASFVSYGEFARVGTLGMRLVSESFGKTR